LLRQVADEAIGEGIADAEQARGFTRPRRLVGNTVVRQLEIEIRSAQGQSAM
jgi:hypothetical protein